MPKFQEMSLEGEANFDKALFCFHRMASPTSSLSPLFQKPVFTAVLPSATSREGLVAATAAATLAYTAWGFGGVIAWSLHIMLLGGLLTLGIALIPTRQGAGPRRKESGKKRKHSEGRISKFLDRQWPEGLHPTTLLFTSAFLFYLLIAALNPAHQILSDERGWWLSSIDPPLGDWLPSSVRSDYEPMNPWRIFNMHLAAFSLALGLKLGLRRRSSLLVVLWFFVSSTAIMAAFAIYQKYSGMAEVLGTYKSENENFWGSFFYRNQAVAFLNWGLVLAGVLYFFHAARAQLQARTGGPHFLAFCSIGLIAVSVGLALSRGGVVFAALLLVIFLFLVLFDYFYRSFVQTSRHTIGLTAALTATLAVLFSIGLVQVNRAIDWEAIEQRFGDVGKTINEADSDARMLSSKMTWKMAQDRLWTGWGPGSFRYAFPIYQQEEPTIFYSHYHRKRGWLGRKFYRYAHNDILQFLAEYGIFGYSLLLATLLCFLAPAFEALRERPFAVLFLLGGIIAAMGHATLDFIFHSPAFWVAFVAGIAGTSQLLQMESRRG